MRILSIFVLLFSFLTTLNAQNNYKEGYIITNQKDTIRGLINLRTNKINSKGCQFKETPNDADKIYSPGEIAGYRFEKEGRYYITKDIEIDSVSSKVFVEYLLQGKMNLYFYSDNLDYYFFEDEQGKIAYMTKQLDDKTTDIGDGKYRGIMFYLFKDCFPVAEQAYKTPFNRRAIVKLTKEYHEEMCTDGEKCIEFEAKREGKFINAKYSVYAGLGLQTYSFYDDRLSTVNPLKYVSPAIGGQVNFYFPQSSESFSLLLDASVSSLKADGESSSTSASGAVSSTVYNFEALAFTGRLGAKYTYPKGTFRPTAEGGLSFSSLFNKSSTYSHKRPMQLVPIDRENFILPQTSLPGFYGAIGLDFQIKESQFIFLRILYDNVKRHGDKLKTFQLNLGYTF